MSTQTPNWWKTGTCYQIWPASFKDGNGDGLGDIPGILNSLDHLSNLGVDILWLCPMYKSPQADMGYDISDYESVHPPYGTLEDMEKLSKECHKRGMKLILDLVINHTSNEHNWFIESCKSRRGTYADYYIWRDGKIVNGKRCPPNNWRSVFGGSAWEYVEARDQYYFHLFAREQPDLNWESETTRRAIYNSAIKFWLDRGVNGFRVDVANFYSKDPTFPDLPIVEDQEFQACLPYIANGPRMHEWLKEIRHDVLDHYGDVMMVGETAETSDQGVALSYVSAASREFDMIFDTEAVCIGGRLDLSNPQHIWRHTLPQFKDALQKVQYMVNSTDGWGTVFLENHDQVRSVSRFATDREQYRERAAKLLSMLLCTLTGTLFIYQGQEIGMTNMPNDWPIEDFKDVASLNAYEGKAKRHNNDPAWMDKVLKGLRMWARDNSRLPVQWDSSDYAGFSSAEPWMRVHDNYPAINVEEQMKRTDSPLHFWINMLKLRKEYTDLAIMGAFRIWDKNDLEVFTYVKTDHAGNALLVYLNFSDDEQPLFWEEGWQAREKNLVISNVEQSDSEMIGGDRLQPWEGRIYHVPRQ